MRQIAKKLAPSWSNFLGRTHAVHISTSCDLNDRKKHFPKLFTKRTAVPCVRLGGGRSSTHPVGQHKHIIPLIASIWLAYCNIKHHHHRQLKKLADVWCDVNCDCDTVMLITGISSMYNLGKTVKQYLSSKKIVIHVQVRASRRLKRGRKERRSAIQMIWLFYQSTLSP